MEVKLHDLDTRLMIFTLRPFYPRGKSSRYSLKRRLDRHHGGLGAVTEGKTVYDLMNRQ